MTLVPSFDIAGLGGTINNFPRIEGSPATTNVSTTFGEDTVNLPSGIVSGELLLMIFGCDQNPNIAGPSGWTQEAAVNGTRGVTHRVWSRVADGTEGSTVNMTVQNEGARVTVYRISEASGNVEVATADGDRNTTADAPSLTPSWGEKDILWFATIAWDWGSRGVSAAPADYNDLLVNADLSGHNGGDNLATAWRAVQTATEDPGTWTQGGSPSSNDAGWQSFTIAIEPA